MANFLLTNAHRIEETIREQICFQSHGLLARTAIKRGEFDAALKEIGKVFDLTTNQQMNYGTKWSVDNLELWRDIARIRALRHDFVGAAHAYQTLAQAMGVYAADSVAALNGP